MNSALSMADAVHDLESVATDATAQGTAAAGGGCIAVH